MNPEFYLLFHLFLVYSDFLIALFLDKYVKKKVLVSDKLVFYEQNEETT